jgi:hypothetical protein
MITKENILNILNETGNPSTFFYSDVYYLNVYTFIYDIVSAIATHCHYNTESKEKMVASFSEQDLKEFEEELLSKALMPNYIQHVKYSVLYEYVISCKYDEKTIKNIIYSDAIKNVGNVEFLNDVEKIMDIVFSKEEKKEITAKFWNDCFIHMKFVFFENKKTVNKYAFNYLNIALNNIYKDKSKIEEIEKEIFQSKIDVLFSTLEKKYIRRIYKNMLIVIQENTIPQYVKIGVPIFLKYPEFRKMYIEIKLGE